MIKYFFTHILAGLFIHANSQHKIFHVGDTAFCGIVFYVETDSASGRQHGLVCALADQSSGIQWYNGKYKNTFAINDRLFDKPNADTIRFVQGEGSYAATICDQFRTPDSNCVNWYLPSKAELLLVFKNLAAKGIGNFANVGYWTSLEVWKGKKPRKPQRRAWVVDFFDGKTVTNTKINDNRVRAIRQFRN